VHEVDDFFCFMLQKNYTQGIEKALPEMREVPFTFDHEGSKVLYYY
jgi:hypothetical protein